MAGHELGQPLHDRLIGRRAGADVLQHASSGAPQHGFQRGRRERPKLIGAGPEQARCGLKRDQARRRAAIR